MNSFPLRRARGKPLPLSELALHLSAPPPDADVDISGVAPLASAGEGYLGFMAHRRYKEDLAHSRAGALLISEELVPLVQYDPRPRLVVPDAHRALAALLELFHPLEASQAAVHPTAVLGRGVVLGEGVRIAPYAVLEEGVTLGAGVSVGAHVVVGAGAEVGRESVLHPHAVLYPGVRVGARCIVHAGACIGVDGFGYVEEGGRLLKVPQVGGCTLGDDVEIGANTTLDRGSIGETLVGEGTKLDNLVHLAHNVEVGRSTVLAAQVGVAGSSVLGSGVQSGGQVGITGHVHIGDGARLAARAGIIGDVPPGETVMGFPARPRMEFLRGVAAPGRIPALQARLRTLEARVRALVESVAEGGKGEGS